MKSKTIIESMGVEPEEDPKTLLRQTREQIDAKAAAAAAAAEKKRTKAIIKIAREQYQRDGEIEIDDNAELSEGEDNGTYVQAWVWVSFYDTKFNKEQAPEG